MLSVLLIWIVDKVERCCRNGTPGNTGVGCRLAPVSTVPPHTPAPLISLLSLQCSSVSTQHPPGVPYILPYFSIQYSSCYKQPSSQLSYPIHALKIFIFSSIETRSFGRYSFSSGFKGQKGQEGLICLLKLFSELSFL